MLCSRSPPSRLRWRRGGSRWRARSTSDLDHGSVRAAAHVAKRTLLGSIVNGSFDDAIRNEPSTEGSSRKVNSPLEVKLSERGERRRGREVGNKRGLSEEFTDRWGKSDVAGSRLTASVKGEVKYIIDGSLSEASKLSAWGGGGGWSKIFPRARFRLGWDRRSLRIRST